MVLVNVCGLTSIYLVDGGYDFWFLMSNPNISVVWLLENLRSFVRSLLVNCYGTCFVVWLRISLTVKKGWHLLSCFVCVSYLRRCSAIIENYFGTF